MLEIPDAHVVRHLRAENVWWQAPHRVASDVDRLSPRAYLSPFLSLVTTHGVRRAVVLLGPRRVGKTVLIRHAIRALLDQGVPPDRLCYVSVDHPIYTGRSLHALVDFYKATRDTARSAPGPTYVFFDEIQYLRDWEVHLKALVDEYPDIRFVASGSAAAALRLKSRESGAGRFTDFLLPALTFHEFLDLTGESALVEPDDAGHWPYVPDLTALNARFVEYLNVGGYPEVALNPLVQADPGRYVKADIIDKVLLRDLPGLYGIQDVQELNALFATLAYNTAAEVSLDELATRSGVAKDTLKRYIEYLEAAFLIRIVHRVDRSAHRFQRAVRFKVYLTSPSMRAALFTPVAADDEAIGHLAETAVFSHWLHDAPPLHYARWRSGEVDLVALGRDQRVAWALEVKWSDRVLGRPAELGALVRFCREQRLERAWVTTRTVAGETVIGGVRIRLVPTAVYCHHVGRGLVSGQLTLD